MGHDPGRSSDGRRDEKDALTGGGYPAGQKPTLDGFCSRSVI
jgi:hypothetical protein